MFAALKNHSFAVRAFFEYSAVLTFAAPVEELAPLIPPCFSLDTYGDRFGFVAAALVKTRALRPAVFPAWLGSDFHLIGYRVFVRHRNAAGRARRGLYILGSATDSRRMRLLGGIFTHYRYKTVDIKTEHAKDRLRVTSRAAGLDVEMDWGVDADAAPALPPGSPFPDWKTARRFAGPLPFTFSWLPRTNEVLSVEGVRENWTPAPARILRARVPFVESLPCPGLVPAAAFVVRDVPYRWEKGRLEPCAP